MSKWNDSHTTLSKQRGKDLSSSLKQGRLVLKRVKHIWETECIRTNVDNLETKLVKYYRAIQCKAGITCLSEEKSSEFLLDTSLQVPSNFTEPEL